MVVSHPDGLYAGGPASSVMPVGDELHYSCLRREACMLTFHDSSGRKSTGATALGLAGIVLIILGIVSLVYRGITYTTREKIIEIGSLKATAEREKEIPLPPVVGVVSLVGGIALLVVAARRSRI